jgi:hypothetical protein
MRTKKKRGGTSSSERRHWEETELKQVNDIFAAVRSHIKKMETALKYKDTISPPETNFLVTTAYDFMENYFFKRLAKFHADKKNRDTFKHLNQKLDSLSEEILEANNTNKLKRLEQKRQSVIDLTNSSEDVPKNPAKRAYIDLISDDHKLSYKKMVKLAASRTPNEIERIDRTRGRDPRFTDEQEEELYKKFQKLESRIESRSHRLSLRELPMAYREEEKEELYKLFISCNERKRVMFIDFWYDGALSNKFTYDEKINMLNYFLTLNDTDAKQYLTLFEEPDDEEMMNAVFSNKKSKKKR